MIDPGDPYACAKLGALEVSQGDRRRGIALLEEGLARAGAEATRTDAARHHRPDAPSRNATNCCSISPSPAAPTIPPPPPSSTGRPWRCPWRGDSPWGQDSTSPPCCWARGSLEEAAALTGAVTALCPELPLGWYNLGLIERQRGRLVEAIAAYRQALSLAPDHADAQRNLAAALLLGGDIPGARAGFRRAIALLKDQGQQAEARDLARRAGALVRLEA